MNEYLAIMTARAEHDEMLRSLPAVWDDVFESTERHTWLRQQITRLLRALDNRRLARRQWFEQRPAKAPETPHPVQAHDVFTRIYVSDPCDGEDPHRLSRRSIYTE